MRPDLNLLTALRILLEERNVTHAAKRLHVSQPAMSKTLQKLRVEFNDPLFTRSSHGLIPTPRAKELEGQLPQLLDQINALVHPSEFSPSKHKGQFRIASTGPFLNQLTPQLSLHMQSEAPNVAIHTSDIELDFLEQLASGQLDFVIHINRPLPDDFAATHLGHIDIACAMRKDHPLSGKTAIDLNDYLDYPHVRLYVAQITSSDSGVVDELLAKVGKQRNVILETSQLVSALEVVSNSDCLLVAPLSSAEFNYDDFHYVPMPVEVGFPRLELSLIQHRRSFNSTPHVWMKEIIQSMLPENLLQASSNAKVS